MSMADTDDDDFDVMNADVMGDEDDEAWDANEMGRAAGEDEAEPLEDDGDKPDDPELEADAEEVDEGDEGEDEFEEIEPPANWPEQEREWFADLPPAMQHAYMARAQNMLADYTRKTQAIAQERQQINQMRQSYSDLERIIGPRQQQWALNGMNPAQAVSQLIALSDFATNDPTGFVKYFSNLRGVDLQSLVQQQSEEYVDPQVAALRQPLAEVQARLNQLAMQHEQSQQQQSAAQYQQTWNATHAAIDNFARQTDQNGNPLYPFFDEVMDDMTALISSGRAQSMAQAYQDAVWLNPSVRNKMLARSRSIENARARQTVQRAKRAAASLSGASGGNGAFVPDDLSVRDTINAAWSGAI